MWLVIACLGYTLLAIVALLDKLVVSREQVKPLQFTFFSTIILSPFIVTLPFIPPPFSWQAWVAVIICGSAYGAALFTMYKAFAAGEVSHNGPLIGAITPLCTFILASIFLPEPLTSGQLGAVGLLMLGSLIITFTKNQTMKDWHTSVIYSFLAGFFFAVYFIAAKYTYGVLGFSTGLLWIMACLGCFGIILFFTPSIRQTIRQRQTQVKKSKQPLVLMTFDKIAAGGAVFMIQFALSKGSPTIINALSGFQYAVLIILVAVITKIKPTIYAEKYDDGELLQEGIATAVICVGLALLVL